MKNVEESRFFERSDFMRLARKVNRHSRVMLAIFFATSSVIVHAQAASGTLTKPCTRQWKVVQETPHDPTHFTQGLLIHEGRLFESTGLYGRSTVQEIERGSGRSLRSYALPENFFSEGLALVGQQLFQLTWRQQTAVVYDLDLKPKQTLSYPGEGWGLTTLPSPTGDQLVLSDGTPWLRFLDPNSMGEVRRVSVSAAGQPLRMINELEYVHGEILANVWHSDQVAAIDPRSGEVRGWFDFSPLRRQLQWPNGAPRETDLNGLAYDERSRRLLVTGKLWPRLFELEIGGCQGSSTRR